MEDLDQTSRKHEQFKNYRKATFRKYGLYGKNNL